jgi:uncharacterized membrane protein YeaQ/YmgE (transglycosylase-associated protein family)
MGKKVCINPYIWCVVGGLIGLLAGSMLGTKVKSARVEEVLVGVFGAFIGGEFIATQVLGPAAGTGFSMAGLSMAVGAAVVMLVLLVLMRRVVGPMKISKSRAGRRG